MTARLLVVFTLALLGMPVAASAQAGGTADQQALQLYEQGSAAYTEGRYEDAVRMFSDAYRLSPRPLLLYNLANAYERIGRYPEAVQMLEGYLPHAQLNERATIQSRIQNLQARIAAGEGTTERSRGGGGNGALLGAGIGVAAGGVALVAAGIVFGVLALDARSGVQGDGAPCREDADGRLFCTAGAESRIADAELFALLADIGMIGGGVVAAAGLVLVILGVTSGSPSSSPSAATLVPDVRVGPNGASFGLAGRF
ncbi:MAG: tetratricopeptide repeat protein [Sandaracinaceae bacterium]